MVKIKRSVEENPRPRLIRPVGFSSTRTKTSTWSGAPGTGGVSISTVRKKPKRSIRCRDRRICSASYQAASNWRISRRITSSRVRVFPSTFTRRTYTRRFGSTKKVSTASRLSRSTSGTVLTLAKAYPRAPSLALIASDAALTALAEKTSPGAILTKARNSSSSPSRSPAKRTSLTVKRSPSLMVIVMAISRRSGEIVTCGVSTENSRKPRSR